VEWAEWAEWVEQLGEVHVFGIAFQLLLLPQLQVLQ
jgi:hypothetical protein